MSLQLHERVGEAIVIAEFLRAEIDSPRFGPRVRARLEADGRDARVLTHPDTSSAADNAYRRGVLHGYRGTGGSAPLLEGLPEQIEWYRASLGRDELDAFRYIDYPYWNELSEGTRSPVVAASRIHAGCQAQGRSNDGFKTLADRICAGTDTGLPIAIATAPGAPLIVLEGHTRVTAMALRPDCLPARIALLAGFADGVRDWMYYGHPGET